MSPRYMTLMASLPPLGGLFEARAPAISRLKLQNRLSLLHPDDRHRLDLMVRILSQTIRDEEFPGGPSDPSLLEATRTFLHEVSNPTLRAMVTTRLDVRTILAALRRRHRGESEPPTGTEWGFGSWVPSIERHWKEPAFRLEAVFPWIPQAVSLLEADDLVNLERLLFGLLWKHLDRLGFGHNFDFEAVVIYIARWALVDRWSHFHGPEAVARFRTLVRAGLGSFTDLATTDLAPTPPPSTAAAAAS
jgi:hypothetical protein